MWRSLVLILTMLLLLSLSATADTAFRVLSENAIAGENPASVVLIGITRAGSRLVAIGEHGVIIFSDDNGKTWSQASVPVNVTLTSVAFATPTQGWASGDYGVILHTVDGGKTWRLQLTGLQVNQMMIAAAQAFQTLQGDNEAAARAVRRAGIFAQAGPDKPFLTILALSPERALVFGAYRMAVATNDGGKTWQDMSLQIGDPISHNIYDATTAGPNIYLAEETGLVLRSSDGGKSFVQIAQPTQATLFGILVAGDGSILVYGVAGNAFRSTDAGATQTAINFGTNTNLTSGRVLHSGQIVIASEAGDIYVSEDNGVTFHRSTYNPGEAIYDFEQSKNADLIFVGNAGVQVESLTKLLASLKR